LSTVPPPASKRPGASGAVGSPERVVIQTREQAPTGLREWVTSSPA
jgi:hypothetical protein